jgi:hypothetical protein
VALAGIVTAFAMFIPLGPVVSGGLAVVLYHRRTRKAVIAPSIGAKLGALSGATGFAIVAILNFLEVLMFNMGPEIRAKMLEAFEQAATRANAPEVLQMVKSQEDLALVAMVLGTLCGAVVLSTLGGTLGASLLRIKRSK